MKAFTPRSWRRTTRARSSLEVQTMEIGIEFLLYLVFGKIPGGLPKNSKKVKKDEARKGL